jgi:hypothetical protein
MIRNGLYCGAKSPQVSELVNWIHAALPPLQLRTRFDCLAKSPVVLDPG